MFRVSLKTITFTYLSLLIAFGIVVNPNGLLIAKIATLFAVQTLLELIIMNRDRKPFSIPRSGLISAAIVALILNPNSYWCVYLIAPFLIVGVKRYLHFGKIRHLANPAGFALVTFSLYEPNLVSWWGVANTDLLVPIIIFGLYTVYRLKSWITVASYALIYASGLVLLNAPLKSALFDPTFLFFVSIMLIEPVTSNFPLKIHRIFYGLLCAVIGLKILVFDQLPIVEKLDPLLGGLVLGGIISGFLLSPKKPI